MTDGVHEAATDRRLLLLSARDNVGVATTTLQTGERVLVRGAFVVVGSPVGIGHKMAVRPIAAGEHVIKYGMSIGSATCPIAPGEHVHTHNLKSNYFPGATAETERTETAAMGGRA